MYLPVSAWERRISQRGTAGRPTYLILIGRIHGELTIEAPEGSFLYAVNADGSVSAIKAEYDEQEEAFKLKTRTLGAYVISDSELKTGVSTGTSSESENNSGTTENVKPNPSTGAIA